MYYFSSLSRLYTLYNLTDIIAHMVKKVKFYRGRAQKTSPREAPEEVFLSPARDDAMRQVKRSTYFINFLRLAM